MSLYIVLLRAIGPVTHKVMSMAQWREAAVKDGFVAPQTYVATGNMLFEADAPAAEVTRRMNVIVAGLGLAPGNRAVVRSAHQLDALLKDNPFPQAASERPAAIGVYFFAAARPGFEWVKDYDGPELIRIARRHLIVDYGDRASTSRLPGIIEKRSGLVTARNWNTLRGLAARATMRNP